MYLEAEEMKGGTGQVPGLLSCPQSAPFLLSPPPAPLPHSLFPGGR